MTEQLRTYLNGNMDLIENEDFVTLIENSPLRVSRELISVLSDCNAFYNYYPIAKQRMNIYKGMVRSAAAMFNLPITLSFINDDFYSSEEFNHTAKSHYRATFEFGKNDKYNLEHFFVTPGSYYIMIDKGSTSEPVCLADLPQLPLAHGVCITNLLKPSDSSDRAIELRLKQIFACLQSKLDQGELSCD